VYVDFVFGIRPVNLVYDSAVAVLVIFVMRNENMMVGLMFLLFFVLFVMLPVREKILVLMMLLMLIVVSC